MNTYGQSRAATAKRDEQNRSRSAQTRLSGACCGACVYFDQAAAKGACRKSPPDAVHGWPCVSRQDWCGAFTRKEVQ